ncbi:arginyl-tRNA synthetase [Actinacidiphila alni]|uniref:arginine--tRNA ligase n=1 Tax=Actinacidiphila alni TaxID=380248 RepID=A0A1I2HYH9_9ACTN|nr:DALR anticodon-binding domain-containing protein [Actinacidiphila alni]SFF35215.1 arginyl-tRNA synthetase [Actinacidiphila alni]
MTPAELSRTVIGTVRRAVAADELRVAVPDRVVVQRPPRPGCGDYATNVALQLAGPAGRTPRQVAEILSRLLSAEPGIAQVEIAGPGFLNITLDAWAYADVVRQVRAQRGEYGRGEGLTGEAVTVVPADAGAVRGRLVAETVNDLLRAAGAVPGPAEPLSLTEEDRTTQEDLFRRLGPDAARWALLRPPAEDAPRTTAPADAEALLAQRAANPLFRIRYAHARTRALLRNAHDLGVDIESTVDDPYHHPAETELLGLIADFPRVVETAARRRAPDRLARHLERLADAFLRFQDECPALPKGDEKPSAAHAARIRLADATGTVLANGLQLLGITAPERI